MVVVAMDTNTYYRLEEEVKNAFSKLEAEDVTIATLLSKLPLKPLEEQLILTSKTRLDDHRVRYPPLAVMRAFLLKELKGIRFNVQLMGHLQRHDDERKLLGFTETHKVPSQQMFGIIYQEKVVHEVADMLRFLAEKIRETAKAEGKLLDIDFIPEKPTIKKRSKASVDRMKSEKGGRVIKYLREEIFPTLSLPLGTKARYCEDNFLDLLAFVAYHSTYANQGFRLMREEGKFEGKVPHGTTMLGYLAKLNKDEILDMFTAAFDRIFRIAKNRGLLKGEVDLAIDFTDWLYYGDKTDKMVVFSEYKNGTTKRFRFITIKIAEKYGDFTLLALPMGVFTDEREAVRTLIEFAKERVKPRYFYIDRGFYSAKYISLFEELGIKYLMPGIKNKRVKRIMKNFPPPAVVDVNLRSANRKYKTKTKIVVKQDKDGVDVAFATNLPSLLMFNQNLFELYCKRWNIETGYRVKKHEFRPNTTSKNWKVRLFYFMFSTLLYNLWVITNAVLSDYIFGEQVEYRIITCKMFMRKFYEAYTEGVP